MAGFVRFEKGSEKFGATHIIVDHFSGDRGQVTAQEIVDIGEVIRYGKMKQEDRKHIYTLWKNETRYRVIVAVQGKKQSVITFYSNKITRSSGDHSAPDGTKTSNERAYKNKIHDKSNKFKYRTAESIANDVKQGNNKAAHAMEFAKRLVANRLKKDSNAKKDVTKFDILCGSISYYSQKIPALSRVFNAAMGLNDNKHRYENWIFNSNHGDGESELQSLIKLRRQSREEYDRLEKDYLWHRDINAIGYTVENNDNKFKVYNPEGKFIQEFTNEEVAWDFAWRSEAEDMKKSGLWSDQACDAVYKTRKIMGRQYDMLMNNAKEQLKECEAVGMELPEIDGVNIFDELRKMGDRRGYYMPRLRHGDYLLWAEKEGENPRLETFDTKAGRALRMTVLEKKGYSVEISQSNRPSEEAFAGANILAMNDLINNALDRIKRDEKLTYEKFGLTGEWIDYANKDGKKERHFVIDGNTKKHRNLFKEFGGNYYNEQWHFKDRQANFPKQMLNTIAHVEGTRIVQIEALSQALTEHLAAIIHSHGSRARKIGRDGRVGKDVYLGFEEDALRAVTMAGRSCAAGTAKRIMAKDMLEAFTGTDLNWNTYKAENMPDGLQDGSPEFFEALGKVRAEYEKAVEERRVDSSKQKNAYKEGKEFIQEMIRNQEPSERVFGFIKGIAAFKYLSGVSSGLVNLTALATSVPAAMKAFGNIPFHKQAGLLAKASRDYTRYMMREKFGKAGLSTVPNRWLFGEITKRGWDSDLRNQEAVGVMQTWAGKTWRKVIETSMIVFSVTERLNRAATIAAAYNGMAEQYQGELSEAQKETLLMRAKEISDKAHGIYGKENLPSWARGSSAGSQIARSFYMYKTFTHNYLQLLAELGFKKEAKSVAWMILSPAIIAGCSANVLTPIIAGLAQYIPGWEAPDDPEEAFYQWLEENFGKVPERFARSGLAGMLGLNLKGSMAINVLEFPTTPKDVIGAPYSLGENIVTGIGDIVRGDLNKGAEKLSPRFIAGGFKAYREYNEGVTSKTNQPLYWGNERLKASFYDALIRAVGFNPAGISEKREIQWSERKIERKYSEMRSAIYTRFRRFMLKGGSTAAWIDIMADIEAYNARLLRQGHKAVPMITHSTLRGIVTRMHKPIKRERIRAAESVERKVEKFTPASLMTIVERKKKEHKKRRSLRQGLRRYSPRS